MTHWTLDYMLDHLSLDQIMMFYNYGYDWEETKALIFLSKYGEALSGKVKRREKKSDKPDIKTFNRLYGDKIKRPNKE